MKRFACLFLLLSSTTSLLAGIDEDLAELFEGDDSPGLFYQKTAREVLGKVTDEPLRKLAIKTSKLAFPEISSSRVDTLHYLLANPSIRSASELQHVFSLFEQKKESYCNLPYGPRLEQLKTLVHEDRFSLRQQRETVPAVKSIFYPPLENFSVESLKPKNKTNPPLEKISLESLKAKHKLDILSVLDQIHQGINLEPETPYTKYALEVVSSLEKGLKLRQQNNSSLPCLEHSPEEKPLSLFVGLANSFSESGKDLKSTDVLSVWGLLANAYFKVALEAFTTSEQFRDAQEYFVPEIKSRIQEKKTTYDWFTLFTDRLSILMTHPRERNIVREANTRFDEYKNALTAFHFRDQPGWYTHKGYKNACKTIGAKYTQNVFSSLALSRELFPDIVMLPYPFELNDGDILRTMPRPEGSHLWALGYALDKVWADGAELTPSLFKEHDKAHLAEVIWCLSSAAYLFVNNEETYVPTLEESWDLNRQGRKLYYSALKTVQEMAHENKNDDQTRMNTFRGFGVFHETAAVLENRLQLLTPDADVTVSDTYYEHLKDPHYYLNLLPDALKEKKENKNAFINSYNKYAREFLKDFAERDPDNSLIGSMKKWRGFPWNTISPQTPLKLRFTNTVEFGHETRGMQNDSENYVKLPFDKYRKDLLLNLTNHKPGSTYQRYYFLGSPFYQGDTPPKVVKETLGF